MVLAVFFTGCLGLLTLSKSLWEERPDLQLNFAGVPMASALDGLATAVPAKFAGAYPHTQKPVRELLSKRTRTTMHATWKDLRHKKYYADAPWMLPRAQGRPGRKMKTMKRMPDTHYDMAEIQKRVMTCLIKNMGEMWRDGGIPTKALMKEIGLQGHQLKMITGGTVEFRKAMQNLQGAQMVILAKQNPKRWELHPEYWKHGVPRISQDWGRDPWKLSDNIRIPEYWARPKKFGPEHGLFMEDQQERMIGIKPGEEWWPPHSKTVKGQQKTLSAVGAPGSPQIEADDEDASEPGDPTYMR